METVSNEDRYAALERKLMEAESALYGCRAMLNHVRRIEHDTEGSKRFIGRDGLYPGQVQYNQVSEEQRDGMDLNASEECIE